MADKVAIGDNAPHFPPPSSGPVEDAPDVIGNSFPLIACIVFSS